MNLLDQALVVLQGLSSGEAPPLNCYWYGAVVVGGDGTARPRGPQSNCAPLPQELPSPFDLGWLDAAGSPLVGWFGQDQRWIAYTDCSGFVGWVVRRQSPAAYAAITAQLGDVSDPTLRMYLGQINLQHGQPWPSAADYAVLGLVPTTSPLQSLGGNSALELAILQPGDILAWGLAPGGTDTGHVVIIKNPPRANSNGSWSVDVIDASVLMHLNDNRPGGTGVGQGTITMMRETGDDNWQINFDVASPRDQFFSARYTSALRVST